MRELMNALLIAVAVAILDLLPANRIHGLIDRIGRYARARARRLYARRLKTRPQACALTGRLVFSEWRPGYDPARPIHNISVELWRRNLFLWDRYLGRARTNVTGDFVFNCPLTEAKKRALYIQLRRPDFVYNAPGIPRRQARTALHIQLPKKKERRIIIRDSRKAFSVGLLRAPFWEYDPESSPVPRARTGLGPAGAFPDNFSRGRRRIGYATLAPVAWLRFKLLLGLRGVASIQACYPRPPTVAMEKIKEGSSVADEIFVDRALNGFNACLLQKTANGELFARFSWRDIDRNGNFYAADTTAYFRKKKGTLQVDRITIENPDRILGRVPEPTKIEVFRPDDGELWKRAKHMFRVNYTFCGQVHTHLTRAHLNVEQYALAAFRNLRLNPVARLLAPHLRGVVTINTQASRGLLGEYGFVVHGSPISLRGAEQEIVRSMGTLDWYDWSPRRPVYDGHRYAKLAAIYWDVLRQYIDKFFATNHTTIVRHWAEVEMFSHELSANSVPFQRSASSWYDWNEINTKDDLRIEVDGRPRAVSRLNLSGRADAMGMRNLKKICAYVIYHATFFHTWANDEQIFDGGEAAYASMGVRKNIIHEGLADALSPADVNTQLFFVHFLTGIRYGYIVKNEDGDIHPDLIARLEERSAEFNALGFDPASLRARINV